jgi:hypothetical protein
MKPAQARRQSPGAAGALGATERRPGAPDASSARQRRPRIVLPRQSEASWRQTVLDYATLRGWRWWCDVATNAPRRCSNCGEIRRIPRNASGHPDLLLVRRPRLLWVELKAEDGTVSTDQQDWLDELRACGQECFVWRPSDWPEVERVML